MSTNVPWFEEEVFKYREGDTDEDIKTFVEGFVAKLTLTSEKNFLTYLGLNTMTS